MCCSMTNALPHLLSYNEPDHSEQSNVSVSQAIKEWPKHCRPVCVWGLRLLLILAGYDFMSSVISGTIVWTMSLSMPIGADRAVLLW